MQTLYILTGLPYSGKTTLTKKLIEKFGFTSVSIDECFEAKGMHERDMTQQDWNDVYSETYDLLKKYLREGKTVIFDTGNLKRSERQTARDIAESLGVDSKLIYLNVSKEEARARWQKNAASQERDQLHESTMNKAQTMFQEPTEDENPILYNQDMDFDSWVSRIRN